MGKRRRPRLPIQKVRKTLKRNPKSIRERKKVKMKTMKARMRKLPKRNTPSAKITDQRAKMKVLEKDRERKPKVLLQMIQILRVKRKVQRRRRKRRKSLLVKNPRVRKKDPERNIRRKRNTKSIRR